MLTKLFNFCGLTVVKTSEFKRHTKEWNDLCIHFDFIQKDNVLQEAELNAMEEALVEKEKEIEALKKELSKWKKDRDKYGRFKKTDKKTNKNDKKAS